MNATYSIPRADEQDMPDPPQAEMRPPRQPRPRRAIRARSKRGLALRIALWALAIPAVLVMLLYAVLLITPIPLPFLRGPVQAAVVSALPPDAQLELGEMALALESFTWPVLKFSPVVFTETKSGAKVRMEALEVGFSPVRALFGQPGASVTVVAPHIQVQQDLFGPRLASFEIASDPDGGKPTVRIIEGVDAFPKVDFSADGIDVAGTAPPGPGQTMRSDNDWLVYNLEAAETGIASIIEQAQLGRFSRLIVRDGVLDMNDALYGILRRFTAITIDITPSPDGLAAEGLFSANFGGTVMQGMLEYLDERNGTARLKTSINNFDLAAFVPFVNDADAMGGLSGGTAISMDLAYDGATGKLRDGVFHIDMTGTELRIGEDYFPFASSIMEVRWKPGIGEFTMAETDIAIGQSTGRMSGIFKLGLDEHYGPTVSMAMSGQQVSIHPNDMDAPETPFSEMSFSGWSAPLYGAMGIDQFVASKPGMQLVSTGRIDMLRHGMGFDMAIKGEGISADDLKRLWPYLIAGDTRDWFVKNVTAGVVESSTMKYAFPVGSVAAEGEADRPIPQNGMYIEIVGRGVVIKPTDQMAPIAIEGVTRLLVVDNTVTIAADGGEVMTAGGPITVANAAMVIDSANPAERVIEISGDITAGIPAMLALAKAQQPAALANAELPIDLEALGGAVDVSLVATILAGAEGTEPTIDYVLNGTVTDFGSSAPIQDRTINNGQLAFVASQAGYRVSGKAEIDGMAADVVIEGTPDGQPVLQLASTIDVESLKAMGFDASEFLSGQVKFTAQPNADGTLGISIDLAAAALTIKDLGIGKEAGVPGLLAATIKQEGKLTEITDVDIAFGDVALKGSLVFHAEDGLQAAEFSQLALSPGDAAQASLTPIEGGYALRVRGDQLDLKPMLQRFFNLNEGLGSVQAPSLDQTIVLDIELKQALGMYKTTAFNLDLELSLNGTDLRRVSLQANLGDDRAISVTTNDAPGGKVMSVAFNDMGTLLRLLGVYPNVLGGEGSLRLQTVDDQSIDIGEFQLRNFSIVDEEKVAEILGNHSGSKQLIAERNRIDFETAQMTFVRRKDRVEVTEALLAGDEVGGTLRGFVYTDQRQYDLVGTYVPLFGFNSAFQKIPLLGPLLGGRDGEGMFGVTFAIRGPLDKPDFQINPASALAIGAFRSLFEFRAKEQPRVE